MTEGALEDALALFRTRRSGELARAIAELGRAAIDGFTPPALRKNMEFHRAWQDLAKDVRRRTWCLDTLIDKLPKMMDGAEYAFGEKSDALAERLAVFDTVDPDPRIGRAILALFELRSPLTGFVDLEDQMWKTLVRHADDETTQTIAALELEPHSTLVFPAPAPLTAAERARWAKSKPAPKHEGALWDAVYAAPRDDEPRAILADHLQERGDPRGEFIALQLQEHRGVATAEMNERADQLLKQHGKAWLGALRPITLRAEMRRGFLARLELEGAWATNKWKQLAADPMLATVEELEAGQATGKIVAQLVTGPVVSRNVRALHVFDDDTWNAVASTPLPALDSLTCRYWKRHSYEQRFKDLVLPYLERTPAITTVGASLAMAAKFSKPLRARLVGFLCRDPLKQAVALWDALPKLRRLTCDEMNDLIDLVRDGKRTFARVHATTVAHHLPRLQHLPSRVRHVEVLGNASFARALDEKYGKRFDIVYVPRRGVITGVK